MAEKGSHYVEQDPETKMFCVYDGEGKKVAEYDLRRDAVKEAARLNSGEAKPKSEAPADDEGDHEYR